MLLAVSPALERVLGPRLGHRAARALLARYPTPTALRAAGRRRLTPLAKRHAPRMGARLVDEVQAALAAQTVTVAAEETAGRVIRELAQELDRLADRRDRLAAEIEQTFTSHPRPRRPPDPTTGRNGLTDHPRHPRRGPSERRRTPRSWPRPAKNPPNRAPSSTTAPGGHSHHSALRASLRSRRRTPHGGQLSTGATGSILNRP
jgi:hypothetical protein